MAELTLLLVFLCISFVLAPVMTNRFFLDSKVYSDVHKFSLIILLIGAAAGSEKAAFVWLVFCIFGFLLYLKQAAKSIFSFQGVAGSIPFIFSIISAVWFAAGVNNLQLLGYSRIWSLYAALHGIFLGWLFTGCLARLSRRTSQGKAYTWGCYLCFILFLFVALGINGTAYVKRIGVVGLSLVVPYLIGLYAFNCKKNGVSFLLAIMSFTSIILSMTLAVLNEFWTGFSRYAFGVPTMVLAHGFMNSVITIPCFLLAIIFAHEEKPADSRPNEDIVFFDGLCVLCNGTVSLLIKLDKNRRLKYSSLQGKFAQTKLEMRSIKSIESVVFFSDGLVFERAEAVIQILITLGGIYKVIGFGLKLFPLFILNALYECVARNRYHIFGKKAACNLPSDNTKDRFIL